MNGHKYRLTGEECGNCNAKIFTPRARCPKCEVVLIKAKEPLAMLEVLTREQMRERVVIPREP
ncbi:hypothetical protein KKE45_03325, partial [Patescibacteria group bacterium]|nr:hypothetical protein [Patescibacteria group bacterium]